jgi:hypothetical protein
MSRPRATSSGIALGIRLATLTLAILPPLAVASALQLGDRHRLVELGDHRARAADLQLAERLILALVDRLPRDGSIEVAQGAMATTKLGADIAAQAAAAAG